MKTYIIDSSSAGQRLDRYLIKLFPSAGKSFLQKMIRKKNITVNDVKAEPSLFLQEGDLVSVFFSDETINTFSNREERDAKALLSETPAWIKAPVFEDENLLVINKPADLLTQPDASGKTSVADIIKAFFHTQSTTFHPAPANRLDFHTSGIIFIPKTYAAQKKISAAIRERQIIKEYFALVKGEIYEKQQLSHVLSKSDNNVVSVTQNKTGKKAHMTLTPIYCSNNTTLLCIQLHTGRSHQIRVQLAAIGHPVIGDPKYGDPSTNAAFRKRFGLNHQLLHSRHYAIQTLNYDFTAPLPDDFTAILNALNYPEVY